MNILVTGGAGYIGSVTVDALCRAGHRVIVLDNLSRGEADALDRSVRLYQADCGDGETIARIAAEQEIEACVHFAALALVEESVREPALYFDNNVSRSLSLLEALRRAGVRRFVFSSSGATYGEPRTVPIPETHPQVPVNPYGWSKLFIEQALRSYDAAYGFRFVALRYFNAAGATETRGERHDPETHLIPNVLRAAAGEIPFVSIYGDRFPTPDGSAVRDYVHVSDLAAAHLRALEYLASGGASACLNVGTGRGHSNLKVLAAARRVTGRPAPHRMRPPRTGDPAALVADVRQAREVLGWSAKIVGLEEIIHSAWAWKLKFEGHRAVRAAVCG